MIQRTLAALAAFSFVGWLATAEIPPAHADDRDGAVASAARIVSIGGDITEILYALGVEDRIVAVDSTSLFPARAATDNEVVGYMRAISPEGVLAASPSVVIAIEGTGPKEAIEVLEKASVPFVTVPEVRDEAGVLAKIRLVAKAVGEEARGEQLAAEVAEDFAVLAAIRDSIAERRSAVFVLSLGQGAPTVGGKGTAADALFALAGVDNALADVTGYKPASEEVAMAANPDAVVIMSERGAGHTAEDVFALPAFAGTRAAAANRLLSISGALLAFGPRLPHAARDLAAEIYPELNLPALPERAYTTDTAPRQ